MRSTTRQNFWQGSICLIAACTAYVALGIVQTKPTAPVALTSIPTEPPPDPRLTQVLDTVRIPNLRLVDALQSIADRAGLTLSVNSDLTDARLDEDARIGFRLRHVDVATAINAVLFAADSDRPFGWTLDHGVIKTFTEARLNSAALLTPNGRVVARVYDVHDLVAKLAISLPDIDPSLLNVSQGYSSSLTPTRPPKPWTVQRNAVEQIAMFITANVQAETWMQNGGDIGTINCFGSTLIIVHTPEVQRRVEQLLHLLTK